MVASDEALEEAGWKDELPYDADRVATLIGTGIGGIGTLEVNHKKMLEKGPKAVSPLDPAADGQLRLRRRVDAPRPAASRSRRCRPARPARTRSAPPPA